MEFEFYQIDSFTSRIFHGNPACVVPLKEWLDDSILLAIAKENAVAETAFFVELGNNIHLRWFTPEIEMDLCGHATLATAHVIKTILGYKKDKVVFTTASGDLTVSFLNDMYYMDFPSRKPVSTELPNIIKESLNIQPVKTLKSRDYVLVYENEDQIRNIIVNKVVFDQINLDPGGVVVTARGKNHDFVSRYFTPQSSILEDPVTGSSHCSLIPFWSVQLGKKEMIAAQLSERTGELLCIDEKERVIVAGKAVTFSKGIFYL